MIKEGRQPISLSTQKGQIMIGIIMLMVVTLIVIPIIVDWVRQDIEWTVKEQKSTSAYNFAEAAVDRGIWKLKSSTNSWDTALANTVISNYNFDKTYSDLSGGTYRIRFTSGPSTNQVTIYGEGRDNAAKQTRAIKCIVENVAIPSSLFSGGSIGLKNHTAINWGPVMSQGNITMDDAQAAARYFPRKYSKQVVTGHGSDVRDTTGLDPPNTDNIEWWSDYDVPDLPKLAFDTMITSAQANNTYDYYQDYDAKLGWITGASASPIFEDSASSPTRTQNGLIWYWTGNVKFTGDIGIKGNVIARGNLEIDGLPSLSYAANIPSNAWKEYQKNDTSAADEYPGDAGLKAVDATFNFGSEDWNVGAVYTNTSDVPTNPTDTKIAIKGFLYTGGNFTFTPHGGNTPDVHGSIWVVGTFSRSGGSGTMQIYYDDKLNNVPALNVVLTRVSWQEEQPSAAAWVSP